MMKSTNGVLVISAGVAIYWLSQREAMAATSTTEAQVVAANEAATELIWQKGIISGFSLDETAELLSS